MRGASALVSLLFVALIACNGNDPLPPPGDGEGLLPPGRECTANPQCQSGWCVDYPGGLACAALCAGECGAALVCKRADGRDPESPAICVPPSSSLCLACDEDSDCGAYGDLCLPRDGASFCGTDCSETQQCPEGFECRSVQEGGVELSRQCIPVSGTCTCDAQNDGLRRPCQKSTPGVGSCSGEETCVAGVGWVSCDARTPVPELCDQQDNDCDGVADEELNGAPLQRPCGYGPQPRRQECIGVETCDGGLWSTCSALPPYAEEYFCDSLDDDCDGVPDDGVLHTEDNCAACDDVCPPGPSGDDSTERVCQTDGSIYYCGAIKCREPHFDVNDLESDGCEVEDDHVLVGDTVQLNATWPGAFDIGDGSVSCNDSDFLVSCGLRIPSDDRQHVPVAPPSPNVDYHRFFMSGGVCTVETKVCAFVTGAAAFPGATVEICVSDSVADTSTVPTFDAARCSTLDFTPNNFATITPVLSRDEFVYVRVRTLGAAYGGTYAVATFEDAAGCVLASASDPCSY